MKQEFLTSENEHWYPSPTQKDKWYPSVSTICSIFPKGKGFEIYLANQNSYEDAQDILADAGKRGTIVHDATEALENGKKLRRDDFTLEQWQMIGDFVNWWNEYLPQRITIEKPLACDLLGMGGKIDRVYLIDGERVLLDIKTTKSIYQSQWVQTSGYVKLWDYFNPKKFIQKTAILRLGASTKLGYQYATHEIGDIIEDYAAFTSLKYLWHYINKKKTGPKILEVPEELSLDLKKAKVKKRKKKVTDELSLTA
jgi:hypothetical protein